MDQKSPSAGNRPGLNPRDALDILDIRTSHPQGATELASRSDAGADVLQYLAVNGAPATRAAVAANISTPAATNRLLANDDNEDVRAELAVKIARLMPGLSERESSHVFALTIETLETLARDAAVRVRAILADEIKALDCVPRDVVMALARDLDTIVSTPILQYSPLLSDADLVEIIACGQVQETLAAIASRSTRMSATGWSSRSTFPPWRRCWSTAMRKSARRRWSGSSSRPRRSTLGRCRWRCAPTCQPVPSAASAASSGRPSWNGWQRATICPTPPASISIANCAPGWRKAR
jgi:hypothetical protein